MPTDDLTVTDGLRVTTGGGGGGATTAEDDTTGGGGGGATTEVGQALVLGTATALDVMGGGALVTSVTGQTVVLTAMVTVVSTVLWAGQRVTVGWQEVMVLTVVV